MILSKDIWLFMFVEMCVCGCVECVAISISSIWVSVPRVVSPECESPFLEGVCPCAPFYTYERVGLQS